MGTTSGVIMSSPQADLEPGIPVSAVFLADKQARVYSALSKAEKNEISHRGKSVRQLVSFLQKKIDR